jgi:hypothetical protein
MEEKMNNRDRRIFDEGRDYAEVKFIIMGLNDCLQNQELSCERDLGKRRGNLRYALEYTLESYQKAVRKLRRLSKKYRVREDRVAVFEINTFKRMHEKLCLTYHYASRGRR